MGAVVPRLAQTSQSGKSASPNNEHNKNRYVALIGQQHAHPKKLGDIGFCIEADCEETKDCAPLE